MFLLRRPTQKEIDRFLDRCHTLPLSYDSVGIVAHAPDGYRLDEQVVTVGRGEADFARACLALSNWKHCDVGWMTAIATQRSIEVGTDVALLIRHLGFWSLNGARVLYHAGGATGRRVFGFAYGTLTNHAESGEELFEVSVDPQNGDVVYRIRAVSRAQSPLAWMGTPVVRRLQARFRRDSAAAMRRAVSGRS